MTLFPSLSPLRPTTQALHEVAQKHGVSVSAVAVRWALEQSCVPAVVVGARNARHVHDLQVAAAPVAAAAAGGGGGKVVSAGGGGGSGFVLDEEDNLVIDAAYEGAKALPENDCFVWERGGAW